MARLPVPGGDDGKWGQVLNEFLAQAHNPDGSLKDGVVSAQTITPTAGTDGQVLAYDSAATGNLKWTTLTPGGATSVTMGGDLSGPSNNAQIAAAVVGTNEIADGSVTTAKLADNAVTSAKIVDGTITETDLASAVVTKLNAAGTVADGTLLPTKLSLTGSAPTNGQVLTYNTAAQKFEWLTPASYTQQQADWNASSGVTQILNKPVLGTAAATNTTAYATAAQGTKADSAVQPGALASVATTGAYADLTGKPTLSAVATSGSYADLTSKPTIPAQLNAIAGTNVTISGTYPNLTFAATPGAGVTDLSTITTATDVTVVSSTGNDATIAAATASAAGVLSAADKSKLDGLSTVATSGAYTDLTGRPTLSTVATSGSYTDLTNKPTLATVAASGAYADLTGKPTIPTVTDATTTSKGIVQLAGDLGGTAAAPTVPGLAAKADASSVYTKSEIDTSLAGYVPSSQKGAANGVASLDGGGKVPASQLPSYVDDVLDYANLAAFPATGATGVIYVADDTNKIYRWSGSVYIEVSPTLAADPNMGGDLSGTASNAQIVAGVVGTTELADAGVTGTKIASGTITAANLSSSVTNLLSDDIHNQSAAAQVANFYIKTADAAKPAAVMQGTASQTADILQIKDDTATNVLTVAKDGTTWLGYDLVMNTNSTIRTFNKTSAGASDPLTLRSGTTTTGASGNISITSGNATGGNSGDVNIDTGTSSTAQGNINIGTVAGSNVNLSRNSVPVNINGSAYFNRGYTVQGTYTTTNNARTLITGTLASSATTTQYGLQVAPTFTPTGASVTQVIGVVSGPTYSGTLPLSLFNGVETTLTVAAGSSGLVTNGNVYQANAPVLNGGAAIPNFTQFAAAGTMANGGNTAGTVNNFGFSATGFSSGAGTGGTVNNHALNIVQPSGSGGTTNNYGIRIVGNGNGTSGNNYAIYNDSTAPNVLVGNTAIGTTNNPNNYALNIAGTLGTQKEVIQPAADAAGVLTVKNAAGTSTFAVNTDKNTVSIPKSATDPAVSDGDIYYNTATGKFRTCAGGAWSDVGGGSTGAQTLLIDNVAALPAGTPAGTVVVVKN